MALRSTVDPISGTVLLFGGMRLDVNGQLTTQVYANDMWKWDGGSQTWTNLQPPSLPIGRENGGLTFDPTQKQFVLFGGYNGLFLSDLWAYDMTTNAWTRFIENIQTGGGPTPPRRRAAGGQ